MKSRDYIPRIKKGSETYLTSNKSNDEIAKIASGDESDIVRRMNELKHQASKLRAQMLDIEYQISVEKSNLDLLAKARRMDLFNRYTWREPFPGGRGWHDMVWHSKPRHRNFLDRNLGIHHSAEQISKVWNIPHSVIMEYCKRNGINVRDRMSQWEEAKKEAKNMGTRKASKYLEGEASRIAIGIPKNAVVPIDMLGILL